MENEIYDFGMRLKQLRIRRKLTQREVAGKLNVTRQTIGCYERNELTPSLDVLIRMALLYRTSTDYLLNLDKRDMLDLSELSNSQKETIRKVVELITREFMK